MGHSSVIQQLLNIDGIDVDSKDDKGRTPLSYAAARGRATVVYQLLKKQVVDINSKGKNGRTPLSYAAACLFHRKGETVVQLLLDRV
ncbi:uncharacterized protein N7483_009435 [Penicillium malachiteum]|uniref:uncharacterized protein n=1 Tax=Penicillium malachiteum TaxID=1324776 RepID=UPI002546D4A4|nr:uncharacterized protein N7483_009435 [Penicillium malachiteum]KAJ5721501.1 hypothetical protein N7483_009435 [Penicillium malachiteum]